MVQAKGEWNQVVFWSRLPDWKNQTLTPNPDTVYLIFESRGAWLACGAQQVHLTLYPTGSFRTGNIAAADCHFAFRTDNFDGALATLTANGFREDAAEDDPMRVMVRRNGPANFPQLFLLDPDRNIIEINGAP